MLLTRKKRVVDYGCKDFLKRKKGYKENEIIRHDPNPDQQCGVAKRSTKGKAYNNKARATKSEQNLLLESKHLRRVSDGSIGIACTS